jgi:hypothetical protein
MTMSPSQASKISQLYRKHVGSGEVSITRLREVVRREVQLVERGTIYGSRDLLRELRAERNYIGRIANQEANCEECKGTGWRERETDSAPVACVFCS